MSSINNLTATSEEPEYQATAEEMSIDTGDYDIFSSLDDLVVEDATPQEKVAPIEDDVEEDDYEYEEDSTEDDEGFDFDDIEDDDLPEEHRKTQDELDDEEYARDLENEEDEDEDVDEYEDEEYEDGEYEGDEYDEEGFAEEDVDYETYEVTLPNGDNVTLQEAIEGYRTSESIYQEKQDFEVAKDTFKAEAGNTIGYLKLARLEADRVIEDYDNFDWGELSRKDPQAYVENREFLDKYKARKHEIVMAMDTLEDQEAQIEQQAFQQDARTCLNTLQAEIPGWNDSLYQDLMQYAIDNGSPESSVTKNIDPTFFKVMHKARQFDIGKQVIKAKIKRKVSSPRRVTKSNAKSSQRPASNRSRIAKKLEGGNTEDSDIFNALED
jgi:hypothetical protein